MSICSSCGRESPEGFRFCPACGAALAEAPRRELRKVVTIVFCDLSGSTALGDRTDPEALRATMREYFEQMRAILERHGGTVEKFVGDAVMAVFGLPIAHEDDALRAVRAAWQMRAAVPSLGLQARIGVNTGEVVAGEGDSLVTGDAVNVAARLEQGADVGDVLIGAETQRLVRDAVSAEPVQVHAKGKPEPVAGWRILDLDPEASGVARHLDAALVGRERELGLLRQSYERAVRERSPQLFTLLGTAGVGKSRLAAEFLAGIDAAVVRGRCLDYGDGITLWPVIGVLKQLGAEETIERITGTLPASELAWTVRRRLEQEAAQRPLVVVFEDVQWGEATFLDLIDHVADLSRDVPLMLLCLARPDLLDERPGWAGGKLNATTTLLEPLSREESEQLVASLAADLDESVRARVLSAAAGNPLYVEEMVAHARENGDVRAPPTVQALLQARLDRLPAAQRAVIESGAVEGEVFHRQALLDLADEPVDAELAGLVRKELIRPERATLPDDEAYRFRHLLIRDAAYEALPKETRARLHERFARWLEHRGGIVELDEIVGHHLEQAALYRREVGTADSELERAAAARLQAAAESAVAREDLVAADKLLTRASKLLPPGDALRGEVLRLLGFTLVWRGVPERVEAIASELAVHGDERLRAYGRVLEAHRLFLHGLPDAAELLAVADGTREVFSRIGDERGVAETWQLVALVSWNGANAQRTLAAAEESLRHGGLVGSLAMGPLMNGPLTPADARRRLAPFVEGGGPFASYMERIVESGLLQWEARYEESLEAWMEGDAIGAELGLPLMRTVLTQRHALALYAAGDLEGAERVYREIYRALGEAGEVGFRSSVAIELGEVVYDRGRRDEAWQLALEGEALGGPDDVYNKALGPALRSRILVDRGELAAAEELARDAVEWSLRGDLPHMRATAWNALANVLRAQRRYGEAREALEQELAEHELHGDIASATRTRSALAALD